MTPVRYHSTCNRYALKKNPITTPAQRYLRKVYRVITDHDIEIVSMYRPALIDDAFYLTSKSIILTDRRQYLLRNINSEREGGDFVTL